MAFLLMELWLSSLALALALFNFQSIYLDLRNPESTILQVFIPN